MVELPVLVLNQNFEPLNICLVRRALVLLFNRKAEILENSRGSICSSKITYDVPSVIRLAYFVKRPNRRPRMTKWEVFNRDKFTCQYCGAKAKDLTIDHVIPKKRGGNHSWENVVGACVPCNRKKAGRTPEEAAMPLINKPKMPTNYGVYVPMQHLTRYHEWEKYIKL